MKHLLAGQRQSLAANIASAKIIHLTTVPIAPQICKGNMGTNMTAIRRYAGDLQQSIASYSTRCGAEAGGVNINTFAIIAHFRTQLRCAQCVGGASGSDLARRRPVEAEKSQRSPWPEIVQTSD